MIKSILSAMNVRTCCPPGKLSPSDEVSHLVVASMMRSGTHVVIDLILNNFSTYSKCPLYVNLDDYSTQGHDIAELKNSGGKVIKTHYPQTINRLKDAAQVEAFLHNRNVILVTRNAESVKKSLKNFGEVGISEVVNFEKQSENFFHFWEHVYIGNVLRLDYNDLIDGSKTDSILLKIEEFSGVKRKRKMKGVTPKRQKRRILFAKFLTRLLGRYAPTIDTGIRLGK